MLLFLWTSLLLFSAPSSFSAWIESTVIHKRLSLVLSHLHSHASELTPPTMVTYTLMLPRILSPIQVLLLCWRSQDPHMNSGQETHVYPQITTFPECCCSVPKSCWALFNAMDCSLPGFFVREISQARILERVATSFRGSSQRRDRTCISCTSCTGRWVL